MAVPVFDPDAPSEEVAAPRFDPSRPFEEVATPRFDPQAPFEEYDPRVAKMAAATRHTLGVVGRAVSAFHVAAAHSPGPGEEDSYERQVSDIGLTPEQVEGAQKEAEGVWMSLRGEPKKWYPSREAARAALGEQLATAQHNYEQFTKGPELPRADLGMFGPSQENAPTGVKVAAGVYNAAKTLPEFFATPLGASLLATGNLPAIAQRLIAGGFAVDMALHTPEQIMGLAKAIQGGNTQEISEATTALGMNVALTGLTARHALTKPKTPLETVAPLTAEAVAKVGGEGNVATGTESVVVGGPVKTLEEAVTTTRLKQIVPVPETPTPLTTAAVESVKAKEPVPPPAPTPAAVAGESGTKPAPVTAGVEPPAKQSVTPEVTSAKQPWEMTRSEYHEKVVEPNSEAHDAAMEKLDDGKYTASQYKTLLNDFEKQWKSAKDHELVVRDAIAQGKPVPPEVLADYPDLAPAKPEGERALTSEPVVEDINTGALGEMGMGGAKPGEFAPGRGTATGIKNAQVDAERQARGQPPILAPQRLSDQIVWDATMARIDREPGWQDRLVEELKESPRSATSEEVLALDHRYVDLQNEYAKATRDGAQHYKDGFQQGVEASTERAAFYEGKLNELEQVARKIGTEAGRAFRMRQRLLNEDFTLAAMEARARASKGFEPLTAAEHTEIAELHEKLAEAQRKATETEAANSEKVALLETQKALAEAKAAAATAPLYEPRVLQAAEKFAKFMDKKGEDALARIKARLGRTSAGIDPTILSDVGILGAAKITRGAVDFAKWTDAMVRDLGEWFREHAQEGWDTAQSIFSRENESFHKGVDRSTKEKIKRATTDIPGRIGDAKEAIKAKSGEGSPLHSEVKKLVRLLVEQDPAISRDSLIDTIHDILKESIPAITRIEAMDAISGRGKFWTPPQDVVSKTVRDLSTQIRLVGHQLDVEARKPLPRTGYQPEKLTDAARREQQKLNELKRRYGVVVTDPAAQLGSVLNARKTYYTHRIADLQAEIAARQRIVKSRSLPPTDPALEGLKADYARVKAEHDAIFPRQPLTDAQRLERAIAAAERNEKAADEQLTRAEKGDFTRPAGAPLPESATLTEIRARTAALREETKLLKDLATPKKTPEQIALQTLRTRLATEKADLTERLAKGDFSPRRKAPRELALDPATAAAKAEVTLLKEEFNRRLEKHKYELKSRVAKIWLGAKEALNLSRAILTSWDVSAVFRQGGFIGFGNPLRAARALGPMFDALRSDKRAAAIDEQIKARPNAKLYAQSKLFLAPREGKLSGMEEAFMSRLAGKIPGIAASQRAYITFLNKLRADTFDALHESLVSKRAATPEELSAISNYINAATGRGNLGKAAAAGETLATVFFSPRLVASRFQLIAGQPLYRGSAATRFLIAKEYSKFLLGLSAVYSLGYLAGATIETNPTSSDFGKLKFGNTRVDPLGGLAQTSVLVSRLATGEKTNAKGVTEPIRGKVPFGKDTSADVIATFLRTKLSPIMGSGVDVLTGQNVVGEPVTAGSVAVNSMVPLAFRDIYDVMLEQGIPAGTAIGILSMFGMGVQNYDANAKRPKP